jgi:hypothetical protein
MDGRAFLRSATALLAQPSEENWRSAAGRAYYGILHEARVALGRWGFPPPPRQDIHAFVRLRFTFAVNPELKRIRKVLEELGRLRNTADYRLEVPGPFLTDVQAAHAVSSARDAIDLFDQIEADPARRATAIAAITAAFP